MKKKDLQIQEMNNNHLKTLDDERRKNKGLRDQFVSNFKEFINTIS